jgi:hypothetical protein
MIKNAPSAGRLGSSAVGMLAAGGLVLAGGAGAAAAASGSAGWHIVQALGPTTGQSSVLSLDPVSANDAWAAAAVGGSSGPASLVIERWTGASWTKVPGAAREVSSAGGTDGATVAASSASNAWAFVQTSNRRGTDITDALQWRHGRWTKTTFGSWQLVTTAAAFSPANVWAFGLQLSGKPSTFVKRYNGKTWRSASAPIQVESLSALGPDDMWATGQKLAKNGAQVTPFVEELSHWTGSHWHSVRYPKLKLGSGVAIASPQVVALSSSNIWIVSALSKGQGLYPGMVLLHWNGSTWSRVHVPAADALSPFSATSDGHGGLWISTGASDIVHYSHGRWTRSAAPKGSSASTQLSEINWIPGTRSVWAGGEFTYPTSNPGQFTVQGAILRYNP